MKEYPFTILDIAELLQLRVRRRQPTNMDVDCPFCSHSTIHTTLQPAAERW